MSTGPSNWFGDGNAGAFKLRDVQNGYARNFADRIRARLASDAASVEALLSRILEDGEHVEQWAGCAAGTEEILEHHPQGPQGGSYYFQAWASQRPALAVATGRRIFFHNLHHYGSHNGQMVKDCPNGPSWRSNTGAAGVSGSWTLMDKSTIFCSTRMATPRCLRA